MRCHDCATSTKWLLLSPHFYNIGKGNSGRLVSVCKMKLEIVSLLKLLYRHTTTKRCKRQNLANMFCVSYTILEAENVLRKKLTKINFSLIRRLPMKLSTCLLLYLLVSVVTYVLSVYLLVLSLCLLFVVVFYISLWI